MAKMPFNKQNLPGKTLLSTLVAATAMWTAGCATYEDTASGAPAPQATQNSEKNMSAAQDDPFLWLEGVENEQALNWVRKQNDRSLQELKGDERFEGLYEAALTIVNSTDRIAAPQIVGNKVRNFWQDATHVRGIWREATLFSYLSGNPAWETILDIDALAKAEDENWVWGGSNCLSPDNDRCIITLSRGGSDAAVRREYSVSQRNFIDGGFYLPEMKGAIAWIDANTVLVGGDIANDGLTSSGYPRVTRLWKRGQRVEQSRILFAGNETDVGIWPGSIIRDGEVFAFITQSHTFYERTYHQILDQQRTSALPFPRKSSIDGYINGSVILSLQEDWNTKAVSGTSKAFKTGDLVGASLVSTVDNAGGVDQSVLSHLIFRPNSRQAVQGVRVGESAVYVQMLDNIVGKVVKFQPAAQSDRRGTIQNIEWVAENVDLPGEGDVSLGSVNDEGDDFFLYFDSPVDPSTLYYISDLQKRAKIQQSPAFFNTAGVIMRQFEATSRDGTKVPYFVIGKEAVMNAGNAPTIQYGYGGFEIPITPGYSGMIGKLWYENDGLYVIANIRGGGEFGPRWHQAALKENRQRAYDDFFAVSEDLIARGMTSPEKLGALGGSNGGLLMGVAMTQRPDLYNALGIGVPLLDMLRYHKLLAGASWMGEYGNPDIPEERAFIAEYSPYQNLKADGDYPRVYFFTSTKDDRVHPGHARKMAAKMETYGQPFLYYENIEGGHGAAANLKQLAFRQALQYVYFMRQLKD